MKFSVKQFVFGTKKKSKRRFKNVTVDICRAGVNSFVQIGYEAPFGNSFVTDACFGSTWSSETDDSCLHVFIWQKSHLGVDVHLTVEFVPENKKDQAWLNNAWPHLCQVDYCDTQFVVTPGIRAFSWDKNRTMLEEVHAAEKVKV